MKVVTLFKKWFGKTPEPPIYCVCGKCGVTDAESMDNGYCINGHDQWVCAEDFDNGELQGYIDVALDSREEIKRKLSIKEK